MEAYYAALATVLAVMGIVWKMNADIKKNCERHLKHCADGRDTVYRRFDEYKEHLERTHVSKEVHDIKYDQIKESVDEIKADVKELLNRGE